jgi:peptidoglycan/LPS O-acetylase OafA/YrhL
MTHVPALDGVRCYAVAMVVLFHFHLFAGGWIGVQVFFVLSGFLITRILLDAKTRYKDQYFRRFYWRRTLRIFPLYFAYVAIAGLAYLMVGAPAAFAEIWAYLLTYTSNLARMGLVDRGQPYFVHFWSLAIEEQFYLVWPLLVLALSTRRLRWLAVLLLIGVPLGRWGMGVWLHDHGADAARITRLVYVFTLSHFDAFATGAALVLWPVDRVRHPLFLAGGCVALWLAAGAYMLATAPASVGLSPDSFGHHETTFNGYHVWGTTLTNVTAASIILLSLRGYWAPLFTNPIALHIGKVSYGVYVLHVPILLLFRQLSYTHSSPLGLAIFAAYFVTVVGAATLSFNLLESPFLKLKDLGPGASPRLPAA